METVERWLAADEIMRLKARYFRLLDTRRWDEFETLFADDAVFDMREAAGATRDEGALLVGASAITAFVRNAVDGMVTVHHGHMPEIELLSSHSARAVWAMEDRLRWRAGAAAAPQVMHGYGYYHDSYSRQARGWVIQHCRLSRLLVDVRTA